MSDTNIAKFLQIFSNEINSMYEEMEDIYDAHDINEARHKSLDNLGRFFGGLRRYGMDDTSYRSTLLAYAQMYLRGGIRAALSKACQLYWGSTPTFETILPGVVKMNIARTSESSTILTKTITLAEFQGIIDDIKPAGIKVVLIPDVSLSYTSKQVIAEIYSQTVSGSFTDESTTIGSGLKFQALYDIDNVGVYDGSYYGD